MDKSDLIFVLDKIFKSTSNTVSHTSTRAFDLTWACKGKKCIAIPCIVRSARLWPSREAEPVPQLIEFRICCRADSKSLNEDSSWI